LTFPFIFRFRNHHPVRRECPRIFHPGNIDTLSFCFNPALRPSTPNKITLTLMLECTGMDCPIIVFVSFNSSFHHKFTFQRVGRTVFYDIDVVIVHVAVICCEINIPFPVNPVYLRSPEVIRVGDFFWNPYFFPGSMFQVGDVIGFPKDNFILGSLRVIIFAFVKDSPWFCSYCQ